VLHCSALERGADFCEQGVAIFTVDAIKSQLDQFVGCEATVDLGQNGRRQAFLADGNDWIQMVCGGP
jgi:hypothetical protein